MKISAGNPVVSVKRLSACSCWAWSIRTLILPGPSCLPRRAKRGTCDGGRGSPYNSYSGKPPFSFSKLLSRHKESPTFGLFPSLWQSRRYGSRCSASPMVETITETCSASLPTCKRVNSMVFVRQRHGVMAIHNPVHVTRH